MGIETANPTIRKCLEPCQLGAGTPDGIAIAVRVFRGWAHEMELRGEDPAAGVSEGDEVIAKTDLENAFGRMLRSSAIRSVRKLCPALLPMLCGQWRNGKVRAWQKVDSQWVPFDSWRGGWQ
eukprot:12412615-Karenia_brevis.AAC.1